MDCIPEIAEVPIVANIIPMLRVMIGDSFASIDAATGSIAPTISSDACSSAVSVVRRTVINAGLLSVAVASFSCVLSIVIVSVSDACSMGALTRMAPLIIFMYCVTTPSIILRNMAAGIFASVSAFCNPSNTPLFSAEPGVPRLLLTGLYPTEAATILDESLTIFVSIYSILSLAISNMPLD